jgi:hypothetical protein
MRVESAPSKASDNYVRNEEFGKRAKRLGKVAPKRAGISLATGKECHESDH